MTKQFLVALDDGHGMSTAGKRTPYISEIGRFIHENEFNRAVVAFLDVELRRCSIDTVFTAPTDEDTPLRTRCEIANKAGADIFISIHYNAYKGVFTENSPEGISIFHYRGSKEGRKLASEIHKELIKGTKQVDRGIKEAGFSVLKYTNMPAVLSENGFMDNKREAMLMLEEAFQKEVAKEHAIGICNYLGVAYVPEKVVEEKRILKLQKPYMRGEDVKALQEKISGLTVDGVYGPKTEEKVQEILKMVGCK